jgi:branched-chain amino acid transport system permease protein
VSKQPGALQTLLGLYRPLIIAATIAAVILIPIGGSRLWIYNMLNVAIFALPVVGLAIVTGRAGQVSFAQTAFMAVGGYGIAIFTTRLHWNPWLGLVLSALIAAVAAVLIGLPMLRLRGHYLAMGTFALALGVTSFATAATFLTKGAIGISGVPALSIGHISFFDQRNAYILCWGFVALALAVYALLNWSYVGRAWRAIALREDVAASLGVNNQRFKTLAFAIAAVMASVAGSLYVSITSYVSPDLYDTSVGINLFVMLFIGGRATMFGPVVGAVIVTLGPQVFSRIAEWQNIIFLVLLLVVILFMPNGLLGGSTPLPKALRHWRPLSLQRKDAAA